eukprot:gene17208-biopygen13212
MSPPSVLQVRFGFPIPDFGLGTIFPRTASDEYDDFPSFRFRTSDSGNIFWTGAIFPRTGTDNISRTGTICSRTASDEDDIFPDWGDISPDWDKFPRTGRMFPGPTRFEPGFPGSPFTWNRISRLARDFRLQGDFPIGTKDTIHHPRRGGSQAGPITWQPKDIDQVLSPTGSCPRPSLLDYGRSPCHRDAELEPGWNSRPREGDFPVPASTVSSYWQLFPSWADAISSLGIYFPDWDDIFRPANSGLRTWDDEDDDFRTGAIFPRTGTMISRTASGENDILRPSGFGLRTIFSRTETISRRRNCKPLRDNLPLASSRASEAPGIPSFRFRISD